MNTVVSMRMSPGAGHHGSVRAGINSGLIREPGEVDVRVTCVGIGFDQN